MSIHDIPHTLLLQKTATAALTNKPSWTQFTWPRGDWSDPRWDAKHLDLVAVAATHDIGLYSREGTDVALDFHDKATVSLPNQDEPLIVTAAYRSFPAFDQSWRPSDVIIHVYDKGALRYLRHTDGTTATFDLLAPGIDYPVEWCLSNPAGVQLPATHHDFLGGKQISYQVSGKYWDKGFDRGRWLQYNASYVAGGAPNVAQAAVCRAGEKGRVISGLPEGAKDVALLSFPTDAGDPYDYDPKRYLIAAITDAGVFQVYYADVADESHWSAVPNLAIRGPFTRCARLELWGREDLLLYSDVSGDYAVYHLGPAAAVGGAPGLSAEQVFLTTGGEPIPKKPGLRFAAAGPYLGICDTSDGTTTIYTMGQSSANSPAVWRTSWRARLKAER